MNVDELVARVREAIRTGTVDGRRLEGCAFGPCSRSRSRGGAGCHLCDVIAKLPQPTPARRPLEAGEELSPEKAARDGDPKLPGARPRGNLAFEKRRRVGPHR